MIPILWSNPYKYNYKENYYSILSFRTYQIIQFEFLKDKNIIKTNFQKQKLMFRFFKYLNGIHFIQSY